MKNKKIPADLSAGISHGGRAWESNPPKKLLTPITGFEDQGVHQHPSTPVWHNAKKG